MPDRVELDLDKLTLGQMMDIELASGRRFMDLARSQVGTTMIALYLRALRQRAPDSPLPAWAEIEALTMSAALRFASPGQPDSD